MKVICIHPRFAGLTSHHYNESYGFMREFQRRGVEFLLLINSNASEEIARQFNARVVIDDPTFRMDWSFQERSAHFLAVLHAHVDADLIAEDRVLITVSTQLEAHALTCWLQELPPDKKPWIVILILSDRWNRSGRDEYDRQIGEFSVLRQAISGLSKQDARRLVFFTLTDLLADELNSLLGVKVNVASIPLEYGDPALFRSQVTDSRLPRIAVLGGTRREKGSYVLPEIIRACRSSIQVEFFVQLTNNSLTPTEIVELAKITEEPNVLVVHEPMSLAEYNIALNSADIGLFPYEVIPYRKRNSGVFAEAVAYGKPVIATAGTWMAEQIESGRAAGIVFEKLEADCIASAIARCVAGLTTLREAAATLSVEWRKASGIAVFVDLMEKHIASRST